MQTKLRAALPPSLAAVLALLAAASLLGAAPARAQEAGTPEKPPAEAPADAATAEPAEEKPSEEDFAKPMGPPDDFNRGTPQGSMYGYLKAANDGDFARAAEYLDLRRLTPSDREKLAALLARKLKIVLDQKLWIELARLSDTNAGTADDGLPTWRDRLGRIQTEERGPVDILLQRIPREGDNVRIWKISSATVDEIDALYDEFGYGPFIEYLPEFLLTQHFLNIDLWQWAGLMTMVVLAWLISLLVSTFAIKVVRPLVMVTETEIDDRLVHLVQGPVRLALAVLVLRIGRTPLGLSLRANEWLSHFEMVLWIFAVTWILMRVVDLAALATRDRLLRTSQAPAAHLLSPGRKTVKVILFVVATLAILDNVGFNITTLIAGLGVGGIAFALAAQKTIENLFGGVTLFADQPVQIGDFCKFGDQIGTVEEIGLRSTRIRTLDRTVITVPNAEFSSLQIENFAKRDEIRLHTVLGLRYETTPEQLRYVLAGLRELLLAHPKITPDPARVRFIGFGAYSLDLEVYAYARTSDWNEFLQIREDVFLRMMDVIEEAGTGFAFPSQTMYLGKDDGLDEKRTRAAEDAVEAWRNEERLPFPVFAEQKIRDVGDTLDYPPEGSPGKPRLHRERGAPRQGTDES